MGVLPAQFVSLMQQQWGTEEGERLCRSLSETEPSVSVRLNPFKAPSGVRVGEQVPWCEEGFYLNGRPAFTFDPLLHAGVYYVQDASSMFLCRILRQCVRRPVAALDLCAAPGGKSTLLAACLPEGSLLVSNEPLRQRAQVLAENMAKWGRPDGVVTQNYPADFAPLEHVFDLVVADVPCSGEGMFRKDAQAVEEWSLQNVDLCWRRQREIVEAVWPALRPGGLLVYSTCTFNRLENEDNVDWICSRLGAEQVAIQVEPAWGIQGSYHFLPGRVRGEGQFMAVLRKTGEADAAATSWPLSGAEKKRRAGDKGSRKPGTTPEPKHLREWVEGDFHFFLRDGLYCAFPQAYAGLLPQLSRLCVLSCGVTLATMKGRDWQPHHALAMSTARRADAFLVVSLDYEQALAYLRHEAIQVEAPRGYVLVAYQGHPLGFVKNLGARANNLYPQEWRIRSGHTTPFSLIP